MNRTHLVISLRYTPVLRIVPTHYIRNNSAKFICDAGVHKKFMKISKIYEYFSGLHVIGVLKQLVLVLAIVRRVAISEKYFTACQRVIGALSDDLLFFV